MQSDPGDILLYSISSWQELSWKRFLNCFDEVVKLYEEAASRRRQSPGRANRQQVLRDFASLGHIDTKTDASSPRINIAPPMLVALPSHGHPRAVLCGARSPALVSNIRHAAESGHVAANIVSQRATAPLGPTRIEIQSDSELRLEGIARKVGISYSAEPPAKSLAAFSQSLTDYCETLALSSGRDIDWPREDFDTEQFRFGRSDATDQPNRFSRYRDPRTSMYRFRFWQDSRYADGVDLDWGKYALLASLNKVVITYQPQTRTVHVPLGAQLPVLMARALTLCSGFAPYRPRNKPYVLAFEGVPPSIFNKIAQKMSQIEEG